MIYSKNISLNSLRKDFKQKYKIPEDKIRINKEKNRIELDIITLENIARKNKEKSISFFLIEEYPTADGLEVERTPLPL